MKVSKKSILISLICGIFYGFFNYLSGKYLILPGSDFVELRPQIVLPLFIGFLYGPLAGFIVGFTGDRLGYAFQGLDILYAWNWSICNGLIGVIPGFFRNRVFKTIKDYQSMIFIIVLSSSGPIFLSSYIDSLVYGFEFMKTIYTLILPAFITNSVFALLLVPVLLILSKKIVLTIATRNMLLVTYIIIPSVILTYAVSLITVWLDFGAAFEVFDLYNIGILCFFIMAAGMYASGFVIRKITSPVVAIAESAEDIARGDYRISQELDSVSERKDEIGQLALIFKDMAKRVYSRQESLKKEVEELKILINRKENIDEVSKITGRKHFKELKENIKKMREQRDGK